MLRRYADPLFRAWSLTPNAWSLLSPRVQIAHADGIEIAARLGDDSCTESDPDRVLAFEGEQHGTANSRVFLQIRSLILADGSTTPGVVIHIQGRPEARPDSLY